MMEWSSLELKLISCRDLKAFNLFQKLSVYAVVSIFNDKRKEEEEDQQKQDCLQRGRTPVDTEGGGHPEWNHVMQFDLKAINSLSLADDLFLKFKLRCAGVIFGKRTIGEVRIPLKDLIDEFNGSVRFVSYQVRSSDGKPNGVLNFSYEVKGKAKEKQVQVQGDDFLRAELPCTIDKYLPSQKVHCPSLLEVGDVQSGEKHSLYPSLDDIIISSALPGKIINMPCPEFYYPRQEPYIMPSFPVGHGIYYHPCPPALPLVHTRQVHWYTGTAETTDYGSGLHAGSAN